MKLRRLLADGRAEDGPNEGGDGGWAANWGELPGGWGGGER